MSVVFKFIVRYLLPRKGFGSSSSAAIISIFVISLVVWLALVFLSVTDGIRVRWLSNVTSLYGNLQVKEAPHGGFHDSSSIVDKIRNLGFAADTCMMANGLISARTDGYVIYNLLPVWTLCNSNPDINVLIQDVDANDINNLLLKSPERVENILGNISVSRVVIPSFHYVKNLIPDGFSVPAVAYEVDGSICAIRIMEGCSPSLVKEDGQFYYHDGDIIFPVEDSVDILLGSILTAEASYDQSSADSCGCSFVHVRGTIHGISFSGHLPVDKVIFKDAKNTQSISAGYSPPWIYFDGSHFQLPEIDSPVLLPVHFKDSGVAVGDVCILSTIDTSGSTESELLCTVAGFYSQGPIFGPRPIITSESTIQSLGANLTKVVQVYSDVKTTNSAQARIQEDLGNGYTVQATYELPCFRQVFNQFESDANLFAAISLIILVVACSNILSLLTLLAMDKKKEISILYALGASKWTIRGIFSVCGLAVGVIGMGLGVLFSYVTLHYMDQIVLFLDWVRGQKNFNPVFFGQSIKSPMSARYLTMVVFATPIASVISSILPVLKHTRSNPKMLRN